MEPMPVQIPLFILDRAGESRANAGYMLSYLRLVIHFRDRGGFFIAHEAKSVWSCCDKTAQLRIKFLKDRQLIRQVGTKLKGWRNKNYTFVSLTKVYNPSGLAAVIPASLIENCTEQGLMGLALEYATESRIRHRDKMAALLEKRDDDDVNLLRRKRSALKRSAAKYLFRSKGVPRSSVGDVATTDNTLQPLHKQEITFASNRLVASQIISGRRSFQTIARWRTAQAKQFGAVRYQNNIVNYEEVHGANLAGMPRPMLQEISDELNQQKKFKKISINQPELSNQNIPVAQVGHWFINRRGELVSNLVASRLSNIGNGSSDFRIKPFTRGGAVKDGKKYNWMGGVKFHIAPQIVLFKDDSTDGALHYDSTNIYYALTGR